ncbi:hypothetical protein LINPERHAP1_LOCUS45029 [Linum perenne]
MLFFLGAYTIPGLQEAGM